ncbi:MULTISPECIES: aminotransferase class V-fold PLP-dependent enzyme [unclassified Leeuwenhoekiella]|uniref:aminotransferase class V-fold PLP-dependent enzyme n=1 Tax=unclassified Leeuwenhoekiella TaxID=2615029 RepID=UPI000C40C80B|nr:MULTISPECIES: aminotransferase class V-fold PLP-dependent enzyme [unclassified Leeuwenhoekiella]MBA82557.1 aminotransferase [Leeuwenhoekiella sp.]|tara:strand:- start:42884 stop:43954 length:1071 start_codon:yes stop_codon:yes gene_type:complete
MKNLKKEFPITSSYIHLNTAGSGLLSETVLDFRQNHDLDYLVLGSILKDEQGAFIDEVREDVARFFYHTPQYTSLHPSFSIGFNALLEAFDAKTRFLLLDVDYPSINWAVEQRGFEVHYAKIDEWLEDNIEQEVNKHKPDVLCLSLIQYLNGIRIDFDFLKTLKEQYPDMLIVADGTQYLGIEDFDFGKSGIDILGASAYKWLNAGYGNGFFLFKPEVEKRLKPKNLGYGSDKGKYKSEDFNLISRMEPGHLDTLNLGSLQAALGLVKKVGFDTIEAQIQKLQKLAFEAFAERNLLADEVLKRKVHGPFYNIKGDAKTFEKLRSNDVICSQRGDGIRVSFHYFNTESDLQKLLELI